MRKYYLFAVKGKYYTIFVRKPAKLYKLLYSLKEMDKKDYKHGINLFREICYPFNVDKINSYFVSLDNIRKGTNKYLISSSIEKTLIKINYSRIICISTINNPEILKILNTYYQYIFVCDFENNDHFWLKKME